MDGRLDLPLPNGHIQATGIDAAGRKQYRYHDRWRERRDAEKFESMLGFARALPKLRRRVAKDLKRQGMPREKALACAVRLLDRGFFRIGSEDYAEENDTYGLATMRKRHVTVSGDEVSFDYEAKGGQRRLQTIGDPEVAALVKALKQRRGGGDELLAYKEGRRWVDVKSADINEYVKDAGGEEFSAKDFRTWNGTVLAAVALAVSGPARGTKSSRKRAKTRAVKEVARYLGNTPAVARASYIDPRVFDRFDGGLTIAGVLPDLAEDTAAWPDVQGADRGGRARPAGEGQGLGGGREGRRPDRGAGRGRRLADAHAQRGIPVQRRGVLLQRRLRAARRCSRRAWCRAGRSPRSGRSRRPRRRSAGSPCSRGSRWPARRTGRQRPRPGRSRGASARTRPREWAWSPCPAARARGTGCGA